MTDPVTPAADATPPPLTDEARSAFGAVAKWCETQRGEAETTAGRQFRTIWWLLGAGLVLLLTLPLIIAYIDHYLGLEESLPPVVVAEAEDAKALLEANQSEMKAEVDDATAALEALQAKIAQGEADFKASVALLRAAITSPLAVWRGSEIAGLEGSATIRALIRAPDGTLVAAGSDGTSALLLRSTDGVDWTPVRLEVRLPGSIHALVAAPDGTLFAAGSVNDRGGQKVLLLRSTDGGDWTPVGPEVAGERLAGRIHALMAAPDGTLIAAGLEANNVLLLRSTDGVDWTPVRPVGRWGGINALIAAPDGRLIAAGSEDERGEPKVLLLRSTDGVDWTLVQSEAAGERLAGSIHALMAAPDGTLIAAGWDAESGHAKVLFLRSTDGVDWTPEATLIAAWGPLAGSIHALMAAPDGTLIAAGSELDSFMIKGGITAEVLLLRSTDGADWTPVRPEAAGERLAGRINALISAPDGTLIAAGFGGIFKSVAATEMSEIANSLLDSGVLPPDLVVPSGTEQRLSDIADSRAAIVVLRTQEAQQKAFLDTAEASLTRQEKAVETLGTVATNLDEALRTAEPVRQASRIATRLAIVALLIFLVQIVVNRYRYLQRLAGFYQARAQAFRMLADADPGLGAQLLQGVTATELIASLSPDAIRFDKTATAPTDNLAAILQSALRK